MTEERSIGELGPDDAAAEWLLVHDGHPTAAELRAFEMWLSVSPANSEAWLLAQRSWQEFDLAPDALLASMHQSALAMRPSRWRWSPAYGAACAAILLLCLSMFGWSYTRQIGPAAVPVSMARVDQPKEFSSDQHRFELALADGTHVVLDSHSKILVREIRTQRDISLVEGRAFFDVAHDVRRPFIVSAGSHDVTATGTAFAVSVRRDCFSVVLVRGGVKVAALAGGGTTRLSPGQEYYVDQNGVSSVSNVDADAAVAWRLGYIVLRNVTIRDALAEMAAGTNEHVILGDARAGDLRVTGRFRADDPLRFAQTMSAMYPLRLTQDRNGQITILSK